MPIVTDWPNAISIEEIWQWHRMKCQGDIPQRYLSLAPEMVAMITERGLIQPKITYEIGPIAGIAAGRIALADGREITDADDLIEHMQGATEVLAAAATIGDGLEGAIAALVAEKKLTRALVIEEIGIAALFKLSDQARAVAEAEARQRTFRTTGPICPGDHGISFTHQRVLLDLAGAERIGISANGAGMMRPVRSLSMIVGLGKAVAKVHKRDNCDACKARGTCRYRTRDIESIVA